ncbi:MAG TPA: tetratricopeptide repeat protein [bacterium]|nr:tetratricopeptide repeat protein [bacterium]
MKSYPRSVWAVVLALVIIFVGLFLVCAQRRGTVAGGEDMANNDDQFRQELLQLLDLTEGEGGKDSTSDELKLSDADSTADTTNLALSDDEMLALLGAENETGNEAAAANRETVTPQKEPAAGTKKPARSEQLETTPTTTAGTMGLTPEMFTKMRTDINRLESALEQRSATVDSLQNIITNRSARLQELEAQKSKRAAVTPVVTANTIKKPARAAASSGSSAFDAAYESARGKFEAHQYQGAIDEFSRLLAEYPDHTMADNCQYWLGECYFGMREYQKAIVEFQKVFAYSETDKHDDAQLMIGLSYVRSNQAELAQKAFGTFLDTYAGSEYTSVAKRYYRSI